MKVFGIGLNKTGTKTLGACFSMLGFKNKSYDFDLLNAWSHGDIEPIIKTAGHYDSFEDWPWPLVYKELAIRFPDAKFILTLRKDTDTWFNSLCKHSLLTGPTQARKIAYGFEMPNEHKQEHVLIYNKHYEDVIEYFKHNPNRLLVACWENGDGWDEVCTFLKLPVVRDQPFPHKNRAVDANLNYL